LRTLLKALGLTMWGLIAFGLLVLFILVGYQAATKLRSPSFPAANTGDLNGQTDGSMSVSPSRGGAVERTTPDQKNSVRDSNPLNWDATHKLLQERGDRNVPTVMLWGRVCEYFYISPDDLSAMLARLGARR
jgi:hypothetical protein